MAVVQAFVVAAAFAVPDVLAVAIAVAAVCDTLP
jgi:hypothetical protein